MPKKKKKVYDPVMRGLECPHCGEHLLLVIVASDSHVGAELKPEIRDLVKAKRR